VVQLFKAVMPKSTTLEIALVTAAGRSNLKSHVLECDSPNLPAGRNLCQCDLQSDMNVGLTAALICLK